MEVELMVTKRDDNRRRPTDRVNIEQSASGRWTGRVLQLIQTDSQSWDDAAARFYIFSVKIDFKTCNTPTPSNILL